MMFLQRTRLLAGVLAVGLTFSVAVAQAGTVAYWRFDTGPAGSQVPHGSGADGVWSADIPDTSGNGHDLSVWNDSWAGWGYRAVVPFGAFGRTGAPNLCSVKNTGGYPSMWNQSLRTWSPAQFTLEVMFKPEAYGWRTLIGRDSLGAGTQMFTDPLEAALYLQITPENAVAIKFQDVQGWDHEVISDPGVIQGFDWPTDPDGLLGRWYAMAAVSDGTTLSLYLDDLEARTGYVLLGQVDMTIMGSTDTSLSTGLGSGGDWTAGDITVGRGMYNGGHGDRAYGYIDEVRLSDTPLAPSQFLNAPPDPGHLTGQIQLLDYTADKSGRAVKIELYQGGVLKQTLNGTMNSIGFFDVTTALRGTYEVRAKCSHWLAKTIGTVDITPAAGVPRLDATLINGDVDGDNAVTVFDYNALSDAFDTVSGDSAWNPEADLDGDEAVTVFDYNILSANFDLVGD